jgi:3-methylcrotonyl-CoA carboxylase alpha subunit
LHGDQNRVLRWRLDDDGAETATVSITQRRDGRLALRWHEAPAPFDGVRDLGCLRCDPLRPHLVALDAGFSANVDRHRDTFDAFTPHDHTTLRWLDPLQQREDIGTRAAQVTAPMPGKVVALLVHTGDEVKAGQPLVVTEAMKMEHTLTAPRDGRVAELLCRVGDQVPEGAELLRIESE